MPPEDPSLNPESIPRHPYHHWKEIVLFLIACALTALAVYVLALLKREMAALHSLWIGPIFGTWLLLGVFGRPFCPNCKTRLEDKGLVELDRRKWIIYGCATCDRHWRVRLLESRGV